MRCVNSLDSSQTVSRKDVDATGSLSSSIKVIHVIVFQLCSTSIQLRGHDPTCAYGRVAKHAGRGYLPNWATTCTPSSFFHRLHSEQCQPSLSVNTSKFKILQNVISHCLFTDQSLTQQSSLFPSVHFMLKKVSFVKAFLV